MVDITTTGATLAANNLKIVSDGVILRSQAQLAASLQAAWTPRHLALVRRLVLASEARARAGLLMALRWPEEQDDAARDASEPYLHRGGARQPFGLLIPQSALLDVTVNLADAGVGPVSVLRPDYVFEAACPAMDALAARLS